MEGWEDGRLDGWKVEGYCPVPEIGMPFAAGQLAVFQGASDEHI